MEVTILFSIFAGIFFLCLGSAITAYVARVPAHEEYLWRKEAHNLLELEFNEPEPVSFYRGRSVCQHCQHSLAVKDLIPVLSFLFQRGRCRYCNASVSPGYLFIELAVLAICLPLVWLSNTYIELVTLSALFSVLVTISLVDWRHQWIPDQLNFTLLGLGLLYTIITATSVVLREHVIAMLIGYLLVALLRQIYLVFRNVEAIGLGDAKLLAGLGAWLGLSSLFSVIFLASLLGIFYALATQKKVHQTISFGPFLALAAIIIFMTEAYFSVTFLTHVFGFIF
ncbi:prepilin peptidase [Marinomonas agarivorans]|nr:prepilin peptidase [Marinomonas agarivorans]